MAPETSEQEQRKEAEIVPAAPAPAPNPKQQQQEEEEEEQEDRDVTAHHDSEEEVAATTTMKEALSMLQPFRARISQLLGPAGPRRVVAAGDFGRRCLAFVETELSIIEEAFLATWIPQQHCLLDAESMTELNDYLIGVPRSAGRLLHEVDPSRHTLLRRAARCFRRSNSARLSFQTSSFYRLSEQRNRRFGLTRSESESSGHLGLTPQQLAAAGDASLPLVGIDRPAKKILRWLTHQATGEEMDRSLRVMCIVGPVGIGKTALAMELRNRLRHETTGGGGGRYHFQCNVMAQSSRGSDRNRIILQDILLQLSDPAAAPVLLPSDQSQSTAMEMLVRLVSERLQDKRYFVVIDDMWEATDWQEIRGAFPNTNLDSRILITTRMTSVARACWTGSLDGGHARNRLDSERTQKGCTVLQMKPLSEMDSERLLVARTVASSADVYLPNNMKALTSRVCDGIPLFLTGMPDWLKEEQKFHFQRWHQRWDSDQEDQSFAIYCEQQIPRLPKRLEQALSSVLTDLDNNRLRLLLLYMSMFPYGYKLDKDRLILKWHHEQLVGWGAETFFSQLVDSNVITCVAADCKHNSIVDDEAEACQWQVNPVMQLFLASKSAEMGFVFTTTTLNNLSSATASTSSSRMPRRLALHHPDPLLPSLLANMDLSQTRSLAVSGAVSQIPLDKFLNLVVLDLEGWKNLRHEDLVQVCKSRMFFLRFLSIRNTRVSKLPHEIKELRILGALDVSFTQIRRLPPELFHLANLFRLDLRGTRIRQLPKQIAGLNSLNYLFLGVGGEGTMNSVETAARLPHDLHRLRNLRKLATVDLAQHPASFVRALGDLRQLEVLAITWSFHHSTDGDYSDALLESIVKWGRLKSLTIHCGLGCSMDFLDSHEYYSAPRELERFMVTAGRFASVPRWINGARLQRLASLQITVCRQGTNDLKILADLRSLERLTLGLDFVPEKAIVIENEGFGKLQRFSVECVMPWLTFSTGAMPRLTHLELKFSSGPAKEERVPSGITDLRRISEVVLTYSKWCANSTTVKVTEKAVREQVARHRNSIDLFINGVEDDAALALAVDEEPENATGTPLISSSN